MESPSNISNLAIVFFVLSGLYFFSGWIFLGFWRATLKLEKRPDKKFLYFGLLNFSLSGFTLASAFIESTNILEKIYFWTKIKWIFTIPFSVILLLFAVETIGVKKRFYKYILYIYTPLTLLTYFFYLTPQFMVQDKFILHEITIFGYEYSHLRSALGVGLFLFIVWCIFHGILVIGYWLFQYIKTPRNTFLMIYYFLFIFSGSYESLILLAHENYSYQFYVGPSLFSISAAVFSALLALQMLFEILTIGRQANQKGKKLLAANEEITFLMGSISHDVQGPLLSIRGFTDLLESPTKKDPEKISHYLNRIHTNADHIKYLLKDLADYAKIGYIEEEIKKIDLKSTIEQAISILDLKHNYPLVDVEITGEKQELLASPKRIKEIIINLIQNSLKYLPKTHGRIRIKWKKVKGGTLIRCEDNGIGIPKELHKKVFQEFFRHNPRDAGTGMGLAIVKKITKTFHGNAWIDPDFKEGACVCVYWPDLELSYKIKQAESLDAMTAA